VVEKPIPAILMNYENQRVIVKVNSSKHNMKSSRHVMRRLKSVRKLKNSGVTIFDLNTSVIFSKVSRGVFESLGYFLAHLFLA
jgi:hypothetical protein